MVKDHVAQGDSHAAYCTLAIVTHKTLTGTHSMSGYRD